MIKINSAVSLHFLCLSIGLLFNPVPARALENAEAIKTALNSVVSIRSFTLQNDNVYSRVGSGFIYQKGTVLTRINVIQNSDNIIITFIDGRSCPARVLSREIGQELVLLGFPFDDIPPLAAGSSRNLSEISSLTILGNSLGIFPSVTLGAFIGRQPDGMIEISCLVPPGNSGGPVVDSGGKLVGMVMGRVHKEQGSEKREAMAGIVLPVEEIEMTVKKILKPVVGGRGWIGVSVLDLEDRNAGKGVRVISLIPKGPADRADICLGDTLVQFEGNPIQNANDLAKKVRNIQPNSRVSFSVQKGRTLVHKLVKVSRQP